MPVQIYYEVYEAEELVFHGSSKYPIDKVVALVCGDFCGRMAIEHSRHTSQTLMSFHTRGGSVRIMAHKNVIGAIMTELTRQEGSLSYGVT